MSATKPSIDGFDWGITVIPRPNMDPLCKVRVRLHRGPERPKDIGDHADLQAEIDALCRQVGASRQTMEGRTMVDLADVSVEDIVAAKKTRLASLEKEREALDGTIRQIRAEIRKWEGPVQRVRRAVPLVAQVRQIITGDPGKIWSAKEVAARVEGSLASVATTMVHLSGEGVLDRVKMGRYRATSKGQNPPAKRTPSSGR